MESKSVPKQTPRRSTLKTQFGSAMPHCPRRNTQRLNHFCVWEFIILLRSYLYFCTRWGLFPRRWPTSAWGEFCNRIPRWRTTGWLGLSVFTTDTFACLWKWWRWSGLPKKYLHYVLLDANIRIDCGLQCRNEKTHPNIIRRVEGLPNFMPKEYLTIASL